MNGSLTLETLLNLPNEVMKKAKEYDDYSERLKKKICEQYSLKELKENVGSKFLRFKEAKYLYNYPIENYINISPTYDLKENSSSPSIQSKVENTVSKYMDEQLFVIKFYNSLMAVACKLTLDEATYLVEYFFKNKTEDYIAEKLFVCKDTLDVIKRSCLIKVWIELRTI